MPITKKDVDALGTGQLLWDQGRGSVSGFGARCQKSAKVFLLKYTFAGRQRWHSIGRFGSPWTVDEARAEARRLLGRIASGEDPSRSRGTAGPDERINDFCDRYMRAAKSGVVLTRFRRPKKQSTLKIDEGRIERHIKPLIGHLRLRDVDATVVRQLVSDVAVGRTAADLRTGARGRAIVTGGAGTAARVADLLSGMLSWAMEQGALAHNPVHGVRRFRGEPKDRLLSSDEIVRLGRELVRKDEYNSTATSVVKLLALTGCRLNEIAGLRWSEVDFENGCFRLADTKAGKSMRPLGTDAIKLIEDLPKQQGCEFVFPSARLSSPYQGTKREIKRMLQNANIDNATSHTLRHTFASIASELGYSDATIAGLLGHRARTVTARYVHRPDKALSLAADSVAAKIHRLLTTDLAHSGRIAA